MTDRPPMHGRLLRAGPSLLSLLKSGTQPVASALPRGGEARRWIETAPIRRVRRELVPALAGRSRSRRVLLVQRRGSCSAWMELRGGWCEEDDSLAGVEFGVVANGNDVVSLADGDDEASGWPGDVAGAAAECGRLGGDGDLDDLVAAERCAGHMRECFGVPGGEVGCDGAAVDLGGGGAHAGGERLEHVVAGDPALEVPPVVGDHRQPVVVVES